MMGTPRGWLDDGKRIEVRKAPTSFGIVNYMAESRVSQGEIAVTIDPPTRRIPEVVLHVRPPSRYGALRSVSVNGAAFETFTTDSVNLGKLTGKTNVICKFK